MSKKFANHQKGVCFYYPTYELVEGLENKQKTDPKSRF